MNRTRPRLREGGESKLDFLVLTDFVVTACNVDITFAKPLKIHNRIFDEAIKAASGRNGKAFIFSIPARQPQNPLATACTFLLTGYFGGATSAQARVGASLFSVVFPIILDMLLWLGLYTRDQRFRALIPTRS
jgi:hypothetical protein